jgi:hypothetical protein
MNVFQKGVVYSGLIVASCISTNAFCNDRPLNVPPFLDGTRHGINGHEIKRLVYFGRLTEGFLNRTPDPATKMRNEKYVFQNEQHTILSLVEYERSHPNLSPAIRQELRELLETAKEEFIKLSGPFIEQARGVKMITLEFMKQWADRHNKEQSLLLDWGKQKEGAEFEVLRREVTTFQRLYEFCQDLLSFIQDLIKSCPRAWEQFLGMQAEAKQQAQSKKH